MRRAAALVEGTHDFSGFQASRGDQKGSVRTVFRCAIEPRGGEVEAPEVGVRARARAKARARVRDGVGVRVKVRIDGKGWG